MIAPEGWPFVLIPLCAGVAIDEAVCEYGEAALGVVLKGPERGRVVIRKGAAPNFRYCRAVKAKIFMELFLSHLKKACRASGSQR